MSFICRMPVFIWVWAIARTFQYYWRSATGTKTAEDFLLDSTVARFQEFHHLITKPADQRTKEEDTAVILHSLWALSSLQEAHGGEPLSIPGVSPVPDTEAFFTLPSDTAGWVHQAETDPPETS